MDLGEHCGGLVVLNAHMRGPSTGRGLFSGPLLHVAIAGLDLSGLNEVVIAQTVESMRECDLATTAPATARLARNDCAGERLR